MTDGLVKGLILSLMPQGDILIEEGLQTSDISGGG